MFWGLVVCGVDVYDYVGEGWEGWEVVGDGFLGFGLIICDHYIY